MRLNPIKLLLLLVAGVGSLVAAEPLQDENLLVGVPQGWEMVTGGKQGGITLSEFVPKGQNVDNWTQMITVQIFHKLGKTDAKTFLDKMTEAAKSQNQNDLFVAQALDMPENREYPSYGVLWYCGKAKYSGKGEVTLIRAIRGQDALYLVQKAWRQTPFTSTKQLTVPQKEIQDGMAYLKEANVVDTRK
ncbi:MAG: hypothetical protein ACYC35_04315 [Pirellulales bacterium]